MKSAARIGRDEAADDGLARTEEGGRAGDAVGEDLVRHVTALRRYALLLIGEPSEADDLVQEALTRVLVHTRAWKPVRDLRAYLFTTLHNVFVDGHRRRRMLRDDIPVDSLAGRLATPPSQMDRLELRDLARALAKLPVEQREVVLLIGVEGMSYRDAARVLGVPIGTIMSRLSRGREALRHLTHRGAALKLRVVK
ncbi:MAG TPA: sigma-70 family RNA polymerase sigma factor [Rhodospirillales bacterium]|nr:sigma-70 family RNA polymerase sigma factor [Rhodospirillales bacterium]